MDLGCDIDNLRLLERSVGHKTRGTKTVNLHSYLRFCGNDRCSAGKNDSLWLTEVTGMDTTGCDMPNNSNVPFLDNGGVVVGPDGDKMKDRRFRSQVW